VVTAQKKRIAFASQLNEWEIRAHRAETGRPAGTPPSGEVWQFLRLEGSVAGIDRQRYYLDSLAGILGVLQAIVRTPADEPADVKSR
jgi:hypothetical protein